MIRCLTVAAASLTLAACSAAVPTPSAPPPQQQPRPTRPAPPPPPASTDWMDMPQTPGDWRYSAGSGQTRASYGSNYGAAQAIFAVTCDLGSRAITLARAGSATAPVGMRIRTETTERVLSASPHDASVSAALPPRDALLDAMAFSKGRFAVEVTGMTPLYLPSWIEVSRVLEDCR